MSNKLYRATENDGKDILEILEKDASKGLMEIIYTRRDNPYTSYLKESANSKVYVVKETTKTIATITNIPRKFYINGKQMEVGYITGYKKDKEYKKFINWNTVFNEMINDTNSDIHFCSIIKENEKVINMLSKKRKKVPTISEIDEYITYIINPKIKLKCKNKNLSFRRATKADEELLKNFLNTEGKNKNFFPVIENFDEYTNLKIEDFYIMKKNKEIIATGAIWNQVEYKQYIVKRYHGIMKIMRLLNPIINLLGYIRIPKENKKLEIPFLSFFIAKDNIEEYYNDFLYYICKEISKNYSMFIIGTNKMNVKNKILDKVKNINFKTNINLVSLENLNGEKLIDFDKKNIELECGLL